MPSQCTSKTSGQAIATRLTKSETQLIVNWLSLQNQHGNLANFNFFQTENKAGAARHFLDDNEIFKKKPGIIILKAQHKLINMVNLYKKWQKIAEKTGWRVNPINHSYIADESKGPQTICQVLTSKCLFYYDFEDIMGTAPNIVPSYLVESGYPNCDNGTQSDDITINEFEA